MADKKTSAGNEDHWLWGLGIVAAGIFLWKLAVRLIHWVNSWIYIPKYQVILSIGVFMVSTVIMLLLFVMKRTRKEKREKETEVLAQTKDAVYCGTGSSISNADTPSRLKNIPVWIKPHQRAMHTQVIGTTNAGKTESVILPWAIQDIEQGRGLLLMDGKADRSLFDKLWAYTCRAGRQKDFRVISLSSLEESSTFNPLVGGTSEEITERVFNAFEFDNAYYKSLQFEVFSQVMRIFESAGEKPTFLKIHQAINKPDTLHTLAAESSLTTWADGFMSLPNSERSQKTSGLTAALSHFAFGRAASIFNATIPEVTIDEALAKDRIVYFQLPVLMSPFLGQATGKMVLQCLQSAVANRHRNRNGSRKFFSVYLDDFSEYLYPGFVSILNKSRSANVGIVFAHQAMGDISALGDAVANSIQTNANLKIFMRGNDPDSAEYFSKLIGTMKGEKTTERKKRGAFFDQSTGDISAREVDEFIIHPNHFKRELGVGKGIMVVPHPAGSSILSMSFSRKPDLPSVDYPLRESTKAEGLDLEKLAAIAEERKQAKAKEEAEQIKDIPMSGVKTNGKSQAAQNNQQIEKLLEKI